MSVDIIVASCRPVGKLMPRGRLAFSIQRDVRTSFASVNVGARARTVGCDVFADSVGNDGDFVLLGVCDIYCFSMFRTLSTNFRLSN